MRSDQTFQQAISTRYEYLRTIDDDTELLGELNVERTLQSKETRLETGNRNQLLNINN